MTDAKLELAFTQIVDAHPKDVYYTFATAQGWRDWLCDSARFEARPGGSYQLAWNNGWYAAGTVRECTRPERVALTWFGKGDPGPTDVTIELKGKDGGTTVELHHSGFGQGDDWQKAYEEASKVWQIGLENLESIFTSGEDLRIVRRPLIGFVPSDFNEKIAIEIGVPVTEGVRIDQLIEGMGAERAGLRSNDVIVQMDNMAVNGFAGLAEARQGKRAGDAVAVVIYRGEERIEAEMILSPPPIPEVPLDPVALAERARAIDAEIMNELRTLFEGVSEAEAEFSPNPEEWSAKEVMAHLIISEQQGQLGIAELICDARREYTGEFGNVRAQFTTILSVTSTINKLIDRLEASKKESATLLELAEELKARKGVLWGLGLNMWQIPGFHERTHMDQMRAAIEAAREG
jgi:uncharacterized protein YndB with AHSA1/START domain